MIAFGNLCLKLLAVFLGVALGTETALLVMLPTALTWLRIGCPAHNPSRLTGARLPLCYGCHLSAFQTLVGRQAIHRAAPSLDVTMRCNYSILLPVHDVDPT